MSFLAQVNGAQREVGLYAGVDGAVRKLFQSAALKEERKSQTSSKIDIGFELDPAVQLAILVSYQNTDTDKLPEFPSLYSKWRHDEYSVCIVLKGTEVYSYRKTEYDTGVTRYENGRIYVYDQTSNTQKAVTCTLWYI